ncbi:N-acetylmuramoyl-L-alanine amidase [Nocardioides sp. TRM66260-LWL]|uniref:N-acetylmuramoyl-L-alanine amidase n=1 Tax=Nocardioides sp. TRM66260-LWL TaxID=2874478 RepID=UPI001CC68F4B|nr:N-acetylmuramoyl-L-alanine amidase [Nocardioides sp. TRM66260-LWL]MBZ5736388.1 N-acetylmuramoyl-L-alanine amidase [Nocardioides sp. TRM66260-LWL]
MDTLEVPIATAGVQTVGPTHWRSGLLDATAFTMIGFAWATTSPQTPTVRVRTRRAGTWSNWWPLPPAHEAATSGGAAASDHTGTELVWVGLSDGVQFDVRGVLAPQMKLVLLYPKPLPSDATVPAVGPAGTSIPSTLLEGTTNATERLRPTVLSRATWGADESWRDSAPRYNHAFQQVHVHHTASVNDYAVTDVPAIIRGMYRYHTHNLGWSDLAYNFLVDRFGRIWEGRAGGVARRVRGAHTLGFNATSAGVAVIGNFEVGAPDPRIPNAVAAIAAWKLSRWSGDPLGQARVVSEGSDKFAPGRAVDLPVIDGHRDTNDTACPGSHLYAQLPQIRQQTRALMDEAAKTLLAVVDPVAVSGTAEVGGALTAIPGRVDASDATFTYTWMRNGTPIAGATGPTYAVAPADFGMSLSVSVTASAPGRLAITQVAPFGKTVTARPTITLTTRVRRRRIGVKAVLVPPEGLGRVPSGSVRIRVAGLEATKTLVDGVAGSRSRRLQPGMKHVVVTYASDNGYETTSASTAVLIPGS